VQIFWHFAFAAILLGGLASRPMRGRWAILLVLLSVIILPPVLQSQVIEELGYIWQGRYLLALVVLLLATVAIALMSEFLVSSVEPVTQTLGFSEFFVGIIIIPIIDIYRKYYGGRMALYLLIVSYAAMALAGLAIGLVFQGLGFVPSHHPVTALFVGPTLNYTSVLNVIFLLILAVLGWRFLRTGGLEMLRMMEMPADNHPAHDGADVTPGEETPHHHH